MSTQATLTTAGFPRDVDREIACDCRWQECAAQKVEGKLRTKHIIQRIINRWNGKYVSFVFEQWADTVGEQKRFRIAARRIMSHWQQREVASAFEGWVAFCERQNKLQQIMSRWAQRYVDLATQSHHNMISRWLRDY